MPVRTPARTSPRSSTRAARLKPPSPATVVVVEEEQVPPHTCVSSALEDAEPHGLAATYSFDTTGWTTTGPVTIGFVGTRLDGNGGPEDKFERTERLDGLGPATGKVTLTTRPGHVAPGRWRVVAGPVENPAGHPLPRKAIHTSTQFGLLTHGPGVRLFARPALIGLGALVAIILRGLLAARADLPVLPMLALSGLGCLIGFPGGKVWWLVVNRRPVREFLTSGACIRGFLLVAPGRTHRRGTDARHLRGGGAGCDCPGDLPRHGHRPARLLPDRLLRRPPDHLTVGTVVDGPPAGDPQDPGPALRGGRRAAHRGRRPGARAGRDSTVPGCGVRRHDRGLHPSPTVPVPAADQHPHPAGAPGRPGDLWRHPTRAADRALGI
uniref:Uncharacterized protein n=1 Tax=Janibacter limosus TaxID=53458 RepID=A0AC61U1F7_9MICO|nr:hypothetical protein [Janibacter limosus]